MFIHVDDPHPGRCLNLRADRGDPYRLTYKRCLEAEGTGHVCRFPPDRATVSTAWANGIRSSNPPKPVPWIIPPNESTAAGVAAEQANKP